MINANKAQELDEEQREETDEETNTMSQDESLSTSV